MVVCKFKGCKRVFEDARILPCGKRTCASHIGEMRLDNNNNDDDVTYLSHKAAIKCNFCLKIHEFPDDNSQMFPADEYIPQLLNMSYSCEHDAAKKSFNEVTQLLDRVAKLDKESHVIDYFARVEADILLEKEVNMQKLAAYYQTRRWWTTCARERSSVFKA